MSIALRHISLPTATAACWRTSPADFAPADPHRPDRPQRHGQEHLLRAIADWDPSPGAAWSCGGACSRSSRPGSGPGPSASSPPTRSGSPTSPAATSCAGARPLHRLDRPDGGGRPRRRGPRAGTGRHERLRPQDDGPDVRRRMPARDDRPGAGAGHARHPASTNPRRSSTSRTATSLPRSCGGWPATRASASSSRRTTST